jgi:hypothetical protein
MLQSQFKVDLCIIELLSVHYIQHLRLRSRRSSFNYGLLFRGRHSIFKLSFKFSYFIHGFFIFGLEFILISNFPFKILILLSHLTLKLFDHRLKFFHLLLFFLKVSL